MAETILNMEQIASQLQKLQSDFQHHLSQQSYAHSNASSRQNGFMAKEDFLRLNQASGRRNFYDTEIRKNNDVLKMEYGNWHIDSNTASNWINLPKNITGIWLIDVKDSGSSRKDIVATHSFLGDRYHRTVHTNGDTSASGGGWIAEGVPESIKITSSNLSGGEIRASVVHFGKCKIITINLLGVSVSSAPTQIIANLDVSLRPDYTIQRTILSWENRNDAASCGYISIENTGVIRFNAATNGVNRPFRESITYTTIF